MLLKVKYISLSLGFSFLDSIFSPFLCLHFYLSCTSGRLSKSFPPLGVMVVSQKQPINQTIYFSLCFPTLTRCSLGVVLQ
ncbi:hypothetical protein GQ44DRAFT_313023 [Phaeosphaeriaceae sp. PMI808]|nr:hypothetical protein GQ44DRAFT_313023 [Phaeosphaeriaceae sp. PMI808]